MSKNTSVNDDAATSTIDLTALKATLTTAQRNGRACIVCGKSDYPLKPAGKLLDVDVVECDIHQWERSRAASPPVWLTEPCPAWCVEQHGGADHPDDRRHTSAVTSLPLLTMDFPSFGPPTDPRFVPVELMADLAQHYREAEPRVALGDTSDTFSAYLSLAEAEQLTANLAELVAAARTGAEVVNHPAPGGAAGCQPWCTRHDPGVPDLCRGDDEVAPGARVGLSHTPDSGTVIEVDDRYLSADEAMLLVLAVLRQVTRARHTTT